MKFLLLCLFLFKQDSFAKHFDSEDLSQKSESDSENDNLINVDDVKTNRATYGSENRNDFCMKKNGARR